MKESLLIVFLMLFAMVPYLYATYLRRDLNYFRKLIETLLNNSRSKSSLASPHTKIGRELNSLFLTLLRRIDENVKSSLSKVTLKKSDDFKNVNEYLEHIVKYLNLRFPSEGGVLVINVDKEYFCIPIGKLGYYFKSKINYFYVTKSLKDKEIKDLCLDPVLRTYYKISAIKQFSFQDENRVSGALILSYSEQIPSLYHERIYIVEYLSNLKVDIVNFSDICKTNFVIQEAGLKLKQKEDFLVHISHDLKTPLSTVKLSLSLLKEDLSKDSRDEICQVALRNCEHQSLLLDNVLDFAKHHSGLLIPKKEWFDLRSVIQEAISSYMLSARLKNISLIGPANIKELKICGDYSHIKRIIFNLISNAIQYTNNGSVVVDIKEIDINLVSLNIEDSGEGIAPDKISLILNPFERINISEEGHGLGLTISKILAEVNGWDLSINSELDKGTTVSLKIPLNTVKLVSDISESRKAA